MKNLNVAIDDAVIEAVKQAALRDGMILRKWVERALRDASTPKPKPAPASQPTRELRYEPTE